MPEFNDGQWVKEAEWDRLIESIPASYVIWKDGTTYRAECLIKDGTDYSGTDAATVINNAIDALGANGGKIFFKTATYDLKSAVLFKPCVILEGESLYGAWFEWSDTGYAFKAKTVQTNKYVKIKNIFIIARSSTSGGIDFYTVSHGLIEDCQLSNNASSSGWENHTSRIGVRLQDAAPGYGCYFNQIVRCEFEGWYKCIEFKGGGGGWTPNVNQIIGGRIRNSYIGVNIELGGQNSVTDVDFEGNNIGLRVCYSYNIVRGGFFETNTADIYLSGLDVWLMAFGLPSNIDIDLDAGCRIFNHGMENSGSATISASTYVDVTHGLGYAPTSIQVTLGTIGAGDFYISNVGASTFRVNVTNSGTYTVYWRAEYKP